MRSLALGVGLVVASVGCVSEGTFRLHLVFVSEEARSRVAEVEVLAVERGASTCGGWTDGTLVLDERNVYARLWIKLPAVGQQKLSRVPARDLLFVAEGRNEAGARLLRGCAAARVRAGRAVEINVSLDWFCTPGEGGEIIGNDKDDDCDGQIDECAENADCDDRNVCTVDLCAGGRCHNNPYPNGLPCADMDRCTHRDSCAEGVCGGELKDCRPYSGQCRTGMCAASTGACVSEPVAEGRECDDGMYCTAGDACRTGATQHASGARATRSVTTGTSAPPTAALVQAARTRRFRERHVMTGCSARGRTPATARAAAPPTLATRASSVPRSATRVADAAQIALAMGTATTICCVPATGAWWHLGSARAWRMTAAARTTASSATGRSVAIRLPRGTTRSPAAPRAETRVPSRRNATGPAMRSGTTVSTAPGLSATIFSIATERTAAMATAHAPPTPGAPVARSPVTSSRTNA